MTGIFVYYLILISIVEKYDISYLLDGQIAIPNPNTYNFFIPCKIVHIWIGMAAFEKVHADNRKGPWESYFSTIDIKIK